MSSGAVRFVVSYAQNKRITIVAINSGTGINYYEWILNGKSRRQGSQKIQNCFP